MIELVNIFWRRAHVRCNPFWKPIVVVINISNMVTPLQMNLRGWTDLMECPFVMFIIVVVKTKADIYHLREDKKLGSPRSVLLSNLFGFPEIPRLWLTSLNTAAGGSRKQKQKGKKKESAQERRQVNDFIIIRVRQKGLEGKSQDKEREKRRFKSVFSLDATVFIRIPPLPLSGIKS